MHNRSCRILDRSSAISACLVEHSSSLGRDRMISVEERGVDSRVRITILHLLLCSLSFSFPLLLPHLHLLFGLVRAQWRQRITLWVHIGGRRCKTKDVLLRNSWLTATLLALLTSLALTLAGSLSLWLLIVWSAEAIVAGQSLAIWSLLRVWSDDLARSSDSIGGQNWLHHISWIVGMIRSAVRRISWSVHVWVITGDTIR